jgi:hypothetical protein
MRSGSSRSFLWVLIQPWPSAVSRTIYKAGSLNVLGKWEVHSVTPSTSFHGSIKKLWVKKKGKGKAIPVTGHEGP